MNFEQVQKVLDERNEPGFRMKQIKQAVFVNLISSWEEVTTFSKDLRAALAATPVSSLTVEETLKSADGHTEKVLFGLADGDAKRPEHRAERGGEKIAGARRAKGKYSSDSFKRVRFNQMGK